MCVSEVDSSGELVPVDYASVAAGLMARWPENVIHPSLQRIEAIMDLLGEPQRSYPVIQITGTNGKSSTARMIASLLRACGLRTGLYTSPHLSDLRERIEIDGEPISVEAFLDVARDIAPYIAAVDQRSESEGGSPVTFFETMTAMAYAAFADAPVDVAVMEVGLGGTWDATSVATPQVCVITTVDMDHAEYLGDTIELIAAEKSGIIKEDAFVVCGRQQPGAEEVIRDRALEMHATAAWQGADFWVEDRVVAVGGQVLSLRGLAAAYDDVFVPLFGSFQADNAAVALAAVEAFLGGGALALDAEAVREGFANVTSPGRLEIVRSGPTVIVDAAHNPAGARALADALGDSFAFSHLVGVVAILADKDVAGILEALEPALDQIVVSETTSPRRMPVDQLATLAVEVFGEDRVEVCPRLDDAIDAGIRLAEEADTYAASGVLVTGSVVTAGQARVLLSGGRE